MSILRIIICLIIVLYGTNGEVVELNDENFHDLTSSGSWLVKFFAPWCGHCKELAPIYEEVSDLIDDQVMFGKIDCTLYKGACEQHEVRSYPTLKFVRDGEMRDYSGGRSKQSLMKFVDSVSGPAVVKVKRRDLDKALNKHDVTFVFIGEAGPELKVFSQLATRLQGLVGFVHVSNRKVRERYGIKHKMPLVVRETRDGDHEQFDGPWNIEDLKTYVDAHRLPLLAELSAGNFRELTSQPGRLTVMVVTDPKSGVTDRYLSAVRQISKHYREHFVFANIDGIQFSKYVEQFGISEPYMPTMFVLDYANEEFYPPSMEWRVNSGSGITRFLDAVHTGKIPPRSVGPWWSPMRLVKWFQKWIAAFSDTELLIGGLIVGVGSVGCCFWLFCLGPMDVDGEEQQFIRDMKDDAIRKQQEAAAAAATADDKDKND